MGRKRQQKRPAGDRKPREKKPTAGKKTHLEDQFSFLLTHLGAPAFVRQYHFHPLRKWSFDFAWPELRVAVEIQGGTFIRGRHVTAQGYWGDRIKVNAALRLDWKVFELVAADVEDPRVHRELLWELAERAAAPPHPRCGAPFLDVFAESKSKRAKRKPRLVPV
jgi:hypothetical protein